MIFHHSEIIFAEIQRYVPTWTDPKAAPLPVITAEDGIPPNSTT